MSDGATRHVVADMNGEASAIRGRKAAFWDERMGEGTLFQRALIGPACERLLRVRPGQAVLEVGCGNGVVSRRLADLGAQAVATDVSAAFLSRAHRLPARRRHRRRSTPRAGGGALRRGDREHGVDGPGHDRPASARSRVCSRQRVASPTSTANGDDAQLTVEAMAPRTGV